MLRKWGTLVFLLLAAPMLAMAQNTGKLAGQVIDQETGDALPGASIVLAGTQIGTISDIDGNYFIIGVPVGIYDVQASFVGYQSQTVSGVEINSGYTREINFTLSPGVELDEIVVEYERPLIQKDAIGAPKVVTGEELQNLPVRGAGRVASLQGGVVSNDADGRLFVRGGRDEQIVYFVDGVKIDPSDVSSLGVTQSSVQEQEMLIGSIPAKYGDAMSGVISITTRSGAPDFFGSLEAITSEALDPFGYNLFSGSIGGPIVQDKLSFFVSAEGLFQSDDSPWAVETPTLSDSQLNSLLANPQVFQAQNAETGEITYVPVAVPEIGANVTVDDMLAAINVPEGFELTTGNPIAATQVITADDWRLNDEKDAPRDRFDVNGNLTFTPSSQISIRAGGAFTSLNQDSYGWGTSLYNRDRFTVSENQTFRLFGTWTHRISGNTFYQLQADFLSDDFKSYPNGFDGDVEESVFYGDRDHATNSAYASYYRLQGDTLYVPNFRDGEFSSLSGVASLWSNVGAGLNTFTKQKVNQFRFSASATTQVGVHQLEFGGEFEQQTRRFYRVGAFGLSRFVCDNTAAANCGAENLDPLNPDDAALFGALTLSGDASNFADVYASLPFKAMRDRAVWYGYDYLGLEEVDNQNVDGYLDTSDPANHNVEPHKPLYYAGYIQDKIEFRDLVINLGLRVDVFDNNTLVLKDPFAPAPIIRASDSGLISEITGGSADIPSTIGDDYAVYFNDSGNIVGFRNIDGDFFDAAGQDSDLNTIDRAGTQRQKPDTEKLVSEIFEDYEPEVTVMPRIGVSFPVTNQALFFASYNVTSQRPREQAFAPFTTYDQISGQSRLNNPDLKPEKTTQYELGFRQSLGSRAAFQISAFLRQQKDLVQIRNVNAVGLGVGSYGNVENIDFATTKGLEFEFDLRRTNGVALRANYTFSVAEATGSDSQALRVIQWRGTLGNGLYFPNFISPAGFDRRHSANLSFDYRLGQGEGPKIGDTAFLQNFGFNILAQIGSGMPYTALTQPLPVNDSFTAAVDGAINAQRLPWYSILDLRVDRRFSIGNSSSVTAFVWVENVLDRDNALGVYRASGLPETDGFLSTTLGRQRAAAFGSALGDPLATTSFSDHYNRWVDSPVGVGGNHYSGGPRYSVPRRIRLGVRLNF